MLWVAKPVIIVNKLPKFVALGEASAIPGD
jgi:hypothetical protein